MLWYCDTHIENLGSATRVEILSDDTNLHGDLAWDDDPLLMHRAMQVNSLHDAYSIDHLTG